MNKKLQILCEVFSNSTTTSAMITDGEFNLLWTNNEDLIDLTGENISSCISFPHNYQKEDNVIAQASFNDNNFSINLLPVFEGNKLVGFLLRLITHKELNDHQLNRDFNESQVEYFSHIRGHVSGIISCCMMLSESLEQHELYDELNVLNNQLNYCYKLLASLLNRSEIAKYSFALHNITRVNAGNFINDIIMIVNALLRSTNISVESTVKNDVFIDVDADRFVVLLLNIIVNAVQNNIEEKREICISLTSDDNNAILSILDNGNGMSKETIESIFSKTTQGTVNTMNFDKKSSLGFYIINYFCNAFKATMYLSSKENEGTTISLRIPLSKDNNFPDFVESKTSEYLTNRFSNIYVALSQIVEIKFF